MRKSDLIWDLIIIGVLFFFFGKPLLGMLASMAMWTVGMVVIGVVIVLGGGFYLQWKIGQRSKD
tara:strand:+ start:845 stop:1036 length:192 start_codon:yes stop_codon:yes gene_type:complete